MSKRPLPSYTSKDLAGIAVQHGEDAFEAGRDVILTLKDSSILDDKGMAVEIAWALSVSWARRPLSSLPLMLLLCVCVCVAGELAEDADVLEVRVAPPARPLGTML